MTTQKRALMTFGIDNQLVKLAEECGELIQAALKFREEKNLERRRNLASELADVEILMEQVRMHLGDADIDGARTKKLSRLESRLNQAEDKARATPKVSRSTSPTGRNSKRGVKIGEKSFTSIRHAADYLGMSYANLSVRLRKGGGSFNYKGILIAFEASA